ncbi:hypothetical protein [Alkalilimnicola ehrlichii]|nr:hypothetical protein [Alkalilimnicola ehrlichii]
MAPIVASEAEPLFMFAGPLYPNEGRIEPSAGAHSGPLPATELIATDGSASGTYLVRHIGGGYGSEPRHFVRVNGWTFFSARGDNGERALWLSDGTRDNTRRVESAAETAAADPRPLANFGNTLVFTAEDSAGARHLWRTNEEETVRLTPTGEGGVVQVHPVSAVLDNTLYFIANTSDKQNTLWMTDGTPEGTRVVRELVEEPDELVMRHLVVHDGFVYFIGASGEYYSPGDPGFAGSAHLALFRVRDGEVERVHEAGRLGGNLLAVFAGELYFDVASVYRNSRRLYRYDGTEAHLVADISDMGSGWYSDGEFLAASNDAGLFFAPRNADGSVWFSDGTDDGTGPVYDKNRPATGPIARVDAMVVHRDRVFFTTRHEERGYELWSASQRDDVHRHDRVRAAERSAEAGFLTVFEDTLYFYAHRQQRARPRFAEGGSGAASARVKTELVVGRNLEVQPWRIPLCEGACDVGTGFAASLQGERANSLIPATEVPTDHWPETFIVEVIDLSASVVIRSHGIVAIPNSSQVPPVLVTPDGVVESSPQQFLEECMSGDTFHEHIRELRRAGDYVLNIDIERDCDVRASKTPFLDALKDYREGFTAGVPDAALPVLRSAVNEWRLAMQMLRNGGPEQVNLFEELGSDDEFIELLFGETDVGPEEYETALTFWLEDYTHGLLEDGTDPLDLTRDQVIARLDEGDRELAVRVLPFLVVELVQILENPRHNAAEHAYASHIARAMHSEWKRTLEHALVARQFAEETEPRPAWHDSASLAILFAPPGGAPPEYVQIAAADARQGFGQQPAYVDSLMSEGMLAVALITVPTVAALLGSGLGSTLFVTLGSVIFPFAARSGAVVLVAASGMAAGVVLAAVGFVSVVFAFMLPDVIADAQVNSDINFAQQRVEAGPPTIPELAAMLHSEDDTALLVSHQMSAFSATSPVAPWISSSARGSMASYACRGRGSITTTPTGSFCGRTSNSGSGRRFLHATLSHAKSETGRGCRA